MNWPKKKGIDLDDISDEEWNKINREREEQELVGENHQISKIAYALSENLPANIRFGIHQK